MTLTTERLKWLHDAATELSATKLKMTMRPDELLVLTSELLANRETQPAGFYTTVSGRKGVVWHNGAPEDDTAIYTAPPAPASEPIFFIEIEGDDWINAGRIPGSTFDFNNLPDGVNKLYAAPPAPAPAAVKLPTEFYSDEGVVVRLEGVMAALAVVGVKYERKSQCKSALRIYIV